MANKVGRPRKDNALIFPLKIMLDEETYERIGKESDELGISKAEVLRRAYAEHKYYPKDWNWE